MKWGLIPTTSALTPPLRAKEEMATGRREGANFTIPRIDKRRKKRKRRKAMFLLDTILWGHRGSFKNYFRLAMKSSRVMAAMVRVWIVPLEPNSMATLAIASLLGASRMLTKS